MNITLESTTRIVKINGAEARIWEGTTAAGIQIIAAIALIAVRRDADNTEFQRELTEHKAASDMATRAIPLHVFLD